MKCFSQLFDEILLKIIKGEKGIEVNVSGLQRAGHVLPHPSIVSRYYELGGAYRYNRFRCSQTRKRGC